MAKNITKKIKVSDKVIVIAGKDKGKTGVVQAVNGEKVIVDGVNIRTISVKPTQDRPEGGQDKVEGPIHVSNVMFLTGDKPTRIGLKRTKDSKSGRNKSVRVAKTTGEEV